MTCPAIYDESIANSVTSVIHTKAESIHRACITDWDTYEAAERESQSFLIDVLGEAWYSDLYKPVTFYERVTTKQMLDHLQGICVGNYTIDIFYLQDKMRVMHK